MYDEDWIFELFKFLFVVPYTLSDISDEPNSNMSAISQEMAYPRAHKIILCKSSRVDIRIENDLLDKIQTNIPKSPQGFEKHLVSSIEFPVFWDCEQGRRHDDPRNLDIVQSEVVQDDICTEGVSIQEARQVVIALEYYFVQVFHEVPHPPILANPPRIPESVHIKHVHYEPFLRKLDGDLYRYNRLPP